MTPTRDIIMVRPDTPPPSVIARVSEPEPTTGIVTACGPKVRDVQAGDRVIFARWAGSGLHWDGEDLLAMTEADVQGVIE